MAKVFEDDNYKSKITFEEAIKRYDDKIVLCENIDPYQLLISECSKHFSLLPTIASYDIICYLIHTTSFYTWDEFKAIKSLGSYNKFDSGWVQDILLKKISQEKVLILGKIKHSQSFNKKVLNTWVLCRTEGEVLTAHCTCMAGLGEACSHVGALLYAIKALVNNPDVKSVTDIKSKWPIPSITHIPLSKVKDIDFSCKDNAFAGCSSTSSESTPSVLPEPFNKSQMENIIKRCIDSGSNPVITTILHPFSTKFEIKDEEVSHAEVCPEAHCLPLIYSYFHEEEFEGKSQSELIQIAENVDTSLSLEQILLIESLTRDADSDYRKWFRLGRITATSFKSVCRTNPENPSVTVIKNICYPEIFFSQATEYGKKFEKMALSAATDFLKMEHTDFKTFDTGFVVSAEHSFFGSTPDGLCHCSCCGNGVMEVKCPYTLKNGGNIEALTKMQDPYLCFDSQGKLQLNPNHQYYYQIQLQLYTTERNFGFFTVWSKNNSVTMKILKNEEFLNRELPKAINFFKNVLLPELLGKYLKIK